jgi:hypothetical protein
MTLTTLVDSAALVEGSFLQAILYQVAFYKMNIIIFYNAMIREKVLVFLT